MKADIAINPCICTRYDLFLAVHQCILSASVILIALGHYQYHCQDLVKITEPILVSAQLSKTNVFVTQLITVPGEDSLKNCHSY